MGQLARSCLQKEWYLLPTCRSCPSCAVVSVLLFSPNTVCWILKTITAILSHVQLLISYSPFPLVYFLSIEDAVENPHVDSAVSKNVHLTFLTYSVMLTKMISCCFFRHKISSWFCSICTSCNTNNQLLALTK